MKPINEKEKQKIKELSNKLETHVDNAFLKMLEDDEEINLDFQADSTHYKTLYRSGEEIFVTTDYIDEDGMVYEDEEFNLTNQSLHIKLMIYWQVVK